MIRQAIKSWQQSYSTPFAGYEGEQVTPSYEAVAGVEGEREDWIWVKDQRGMSGWVPEAFLVKKETGFSLLRDFNAVELTVHPGEQINVSEEVGGWAWCMNAYGKSGWVPADCLTPVPTEFRPLRAVFG